MAECLILGVDNSPTSDDVTATADKVLAPYTAITADSDEPVKGTIPSKSAATYNTSTSDQTITSKQYLSGNQTIKGVTTSNISAGNIKKGVVVKVGDANNAGRIKNITGTYTTVSSGQTALTADTLRKGYSGFANGGAEVKGNMAEKSSATFNVSTSDRTITANQYLTGAQVIKAVTTSNITTDNIKNGVVVKVGDANDAGRIKNITGTYRGTVQTMYASTTTPSDIATTTLDADLYWYIVAKKDRASDSYKVSVYKNNTLINRIQSGTNEATLFHTTTLQHLNISKGDIIKFEAEGYDADGEETSHVTAFVNGMLIY